MQPVVLDGPMGTELAARGVPTPGPAWSAHAVESASDVVAAIHRDYAAAGATVHTATTFRTTRRVLGARWEAVLGRAVRIARSSVPASHRVAGSIAPLDDCYRPDLSPGSRSRPEHAELARALAGAGVDVLLCETFPSGVEAAVAVEEAARTGVETWAALTAGPAAALMSPRAMADAARACVESGAAAVLVNCTPAARTLVYLQAIAEACSRFGAYANAGDASEGVGWGAPDGPREYARWAGGWLAAGASIVGGCCGTGPAHVALLARAAGEARGRQR
ncbi:MAG TPA: homocysteine S-methyltransferase family protein [Polyangiaceae bacterium]|nr:homocysteine S-methyltransferase family protein [Polyangiaceae bacterium]